MDQREQFEYGLEFADLPADATAVQPPYRRLHGPNQWPDEVTCPGVKQELQVMATEMLRGLPGCLAQRCEGSAYLSIYLSICQMPPFSMLHSTLWKEGQKGKQEVGCMGASCPPGTRLHAQGVMGM